MFHCIAGKDRTGIVAALTLSLLGVADDDVADDYALSEWAEEAAWDYRASMDPSLIGGRWTHIQVCPREAMLEFLDDVRARHGSVEGYAADVGVTDEHIAAMRAHLLRLGESTAQRQMDALDPAVRVLGAAALDVTRDWRSFAVTVPDGAVADR